MQFGEPPSLLTLSIMRFSGTVSKQNAALSFNNNTNCLKLLLVKVFLITQRRNISHCVYLILLTDVFE